MPRFCKQNAKERSCDRLHNCTKLTERHTFDAPCNRNVKCDVFNEIFFTNAVVRIYEQYLAKKFCILHDYILSPNLLHSMLRVQLRQRLPDCLKTKKLKYNAPVHTSENYNFNPPLSTVNVTTEFSK